MKISKLMLCSLIFFLKFPPLRLKTSLSAYHVNGIFGNFFWTTGTALFRTKETEGIEPYDLTGSFGCQWAGSGYVSTRNVAAELPVLLDVLGDDLENDFFWRRR